MKRLNIVLIIDLAFATDRDTVAGVMKWAKDRGNAEVLVWSPWHANNPGDVGPPPDAEGVLKQFATHGIITSIWTREALDRLRQLSIPIVETTGTWPEHEIASVHVDDRAVGKMAARHLMECGLKHFGFWGSPVAQHAHRRQEAFEEEVRRAGHSCAFFQSPTISIPWSASEEATIASWLSSLPRPVGIMCWFDYLAIPLQHICRRIGLAVPDEVAIIGADNDSIISEQCPVPLTSIDLNTRMSGYKAAEILEKLIRKRRPPHHVLLPPGNLVARQSTDILAIDNADVVAAMQYMRNNANRPITVGDVLETVPVSRRSLEIQFRKHVGRTPLEHIRLMHVERAKTLINDYDLSLAEVAEMSGFGNQGLLSRVFKLLVGCTPLAYRQQLRLRPSPAKPTARTSST